MKTKDDQSVLKNCQVKNIFEPRFFWIIYINFHGTAWYGLFLTLIKVARMVNVNWILQTNCFVIYNTN